MPKAVSKASERGGVKGRRRGWSLGGGLVVLSTIIGLGSLGMLTFRFLEQEKRELAWEERLKQLKVDIAAGQQQLDEIGAAIESSLPIKQARLGELERLKNEIAGTRGVLDDLRADRDRVLASTAAAKEEAESAVSRYLLLEEEISAGQGRQTALQEKLNEMNQELTSTASSLEAVRRERDLLAALRARSAALQEKLNTDEKREATLKAYIQKLESISQEVSRTTADKLANMKTVANELSQTEERLKARRDDLALLTAKKQTLSQELQQLTESHASAKQALDLTAADMAGKKVALADLLTQVATETARVATLKSQVEDEHKQLAKVQAQLTDLRGSIEEARGVIAVASEESRSLEREIKRLKRRAADLRDAEE